jgi:uncharacterized protein YciI
MRSIAVLFAFLGLLAGPAGRAVEVPVGPGARVTHPGSPKVSSSSDGAPTTYYAVILRPVPGRELSLPIVQKHAHHLAELDAQGKLVMAGPFTDSPLGLLIMKGSSKGEITHIMNEDPMMTSGVRTFEVDTWVLANRGNKFMPPIPPPRKKQGEAK